MGVLTKTVKVNDLWNYVPEFNDDGTEKHIHFNGARFHVLSWDSRGNRCSCDNCEINTLRTIAGGEKETGQ